MYLQPRCVRNLPANARGSTSTGSGHPVFRRHAQRRHTPAAGMSFSGSRPMSRPCPCTPAKSDLRRPMGRRLCTGMLPSAGGQSSGRTVWQCGGRKSSVQPARALRARAFASSRAPSALPLASPPLSEDSARYGATLSADGDLPAAARVRKSRLESSAAIVILGHAIVAARGCRGGSP